jgi:hypothetical protein
VHGHDRSGGLGDGRLRSLQVEIERDRVDVDQYRLGPEVADHLSGGCKRPGRDNHLVSGTDSGCLQSQVKARRCGVDRDRLDATSDLLGKLELECGGSRAGRQPSTPHGLGDGGDLVLADIRRSEG